MGPESFRRRCTRNVALVDENAFRIDMPSVHDGYGAARTVTGG
jgi:hypothetical protein